MVVVVPVAISNSVTVVRVEDIRPLRNKILRPHQGYSQTLFPGDSDPDTFHLAIYVEKNIIGIASFYLQGQAGEFNSWRLRGMAVLEEFRGTGKGKLLVAAGCERIRSLHGHILWCNAREAASSFYEKLGFAKKSELFDIEGVGPHYLMELKLRKL